MTKAFRIDPLVLTATNNCYCSYFNTRAWFVIVNFSLPCVYTWKTYYERSTKWSVSILKYIIIKSLLREIWRWLRLLTTVCSSPALGEKDRWHNIKDFFCESNMFFSVSSCQVFIELYLHLGDCKRWKVMQRDFDRKN